MTIASELHTKIATVCQIQGVSLGSLDDKSTWSVVFEDGASIEQRAAAQAVLDAFDIDNLPSPVAPALTGVTPRQARLALHSAGLLEQVQAAVDAAGGDTKISWEYSTIIERNSPLIASIGGSLGLTPEQIDVLFKYAATQ